VQLCNSGNVVIPAIKALRELGFTVRLDSASGWFTAEANGRSFSADDPVAVLGLVKFYDTRGEHWHLPDEELMAIGKEYGLL